MALGDVFVSQDEIEDFVLSMSMRLVTTFSPETTSIIFGGKVNVSLNFSVSRPWSDVNFGHNPISPKHLIIKKDE